ncbi:hypothetical protein LHGZ1_1574 [Laribacter hongkongensis]|uniref:Uncharacterized protein n=1 Tax=Laribacter hongkongensis TaxID=168471 RepID=A0A248LIP5_9NEIS|nr:hypothetical protein LHGZ1_1574 [Laribacter hongkongensis]
MDIRVLNQVRVRPLAWVLPSVWVRLRDLRDRSCRITAGKVVAADRLPWQNRHA